VNGNFVNAQTFHAACFLRNQVGAELENAKRQNRKLETKN